MIIQLRDDYQLELLGHHHAPEMFRQIQLNRQYLRQWLPWPDFVTKVEDSEDNIKMNLHLYSDKRVVPMVITYQGRAVGRVDTHNINWGNKWCSLGYWLAEDHCGKGIMSLAVQKFLELLFDKYDLNKVIIRAASGNLGSQAVAKKCGMRHVGRLEQNEWLYNRFVDHEVFEITKDRWKSN